MTAQIRSELFKLRTTRSTFGLLAVLAALVVFAIILHGLSLPADRLGSRTIQLTVVYGWGERFGALCAALLGAMAITGEIRHGTIRSTLLVAPRRERVIGAKVIASVIGGTILGVFAGLVAAGFASSALAIRGIDIQLGAGDFVQLLAGTAAAAAIWASIGVGLGALIRIQVPTLVGLTAWLLLIESLLVENVSSVGRFAPGAAAQALAGQSPDTLLPAAVGGVLLVGYAVVAIASGTWLTMRRDIA